MSAYPSRFSAGSMSLSGDLRAGLNSGGSASNVKLSDYKRNGSFTKDFEEYDDIPTSNANIKLGAFRNDFILVPSSLSSGTTTIHTDQMTVNNSASAYVGTRYAGISFDITMEDTRIKVESYDVGYNRSATYSNGSYTHANSISNYTQSNLQTDYFNLSNRKSLDSLRFDFDIEQMRIYRRAFQAAGIVGSNFLFKSGGHDTHILNNNNNVSFGNWNNLSGNIGYAANVSDYSQGFATNFYRDDDDDTPNIGLKYSLSMVFGMQMTGVGISGGGPQYAFWGGGMHMDDAQSYFKLIIEAESGGVNTTRTFNRTQTTSNDDYPWLESPSLVAETFYQTGL